jgi:hypothetical protein
LGTRNILVLFLSATDAAKLAHDTMELTLNAAGLLCTEHGYSSRAASEWLLAGRNGLMEIFKTLLSPS